MVYKILFAACVVLEIAVVPWFLKEQWPKKTKKSLFLKMICATLFVLAGVLSMKISGNTGDYATLVMTGLCCCWLGDFFLHVRPHPLFFGAGVLSFLAGHVFYISAYGKALNSFFPEKGFFNVKDIAAVAVIVIVGAAAAKLIFKMKFGIAAVLILPYTITISTMLVKAFSLGAGMLRNGLENALAVMLILGFGSLLFVISDAILGVIIFRKDKKSFPLKVVNIVTYFSAQLLIASSIMLIS